MKTRTVQLGDVCQFLDHKRRPVSEELRKSGPYPYYGANGQQGWIDDYLFDEPLILLAEDGGHFGSKTNAIAYKISGKTWVNNHAHVLRPTEGCDIDYLLHVLSFYDVTKIISGTTRPKLTKGNAEIIKLPLPSLPDQRLIAAQLDQADRLRRTRRYALELSDSFLPAAFLEHFGDSLSQARKWPREYLGALMRDGDKINYGVVQPGRERPNGIPIVRVADMDDLDSSIPKLKKIAPEIDEQHSVSRLYGDEILIACVGATLGKIARAGPTMRGFNIARAVARVPGDWRKLNAAFLTHYLLSPRVQGFWKQQTRTVGQPTLNILQIEETRVIMPPIPLQQQFASLVARHERLRAAQRESLRQAEHLFKSLLQRAFNPLP